MTRKFLIAMAGAAAMTMSAGAFAQLGSATSMATVPNFYAGLEVGQADVGPEDDIGFKIFGGYQFHRNIAVELGYGMLFDKNDVEVTTLELAAVGLFPITNQFSVVGKLGFANTEFDTPEGSDDGTDITWAFGVQFDVTRNLGVRAMWQRYETDDAVDWLTLGVLWRF